MNKRDRTLTRRLGKNASLIAFSELLGCMSFFLPVAILIFEKLTGSYTLGMSAITAMAFASALFEVPTGILSDLWGRRGVMIAGAACMFLAILILGMAFHTAYPLPLLYFGMLIYGLARALFSGNEEALLYESLAALKKGGQFPKAIGRVTSLSQIGLAMGAVGSGLMLWLGLSYEHLVWLTLIPLSGDILASLLMSEPPARFHKESDSGSHLGLGLINYSQKATIEARKTAAMKV